MPFNSKPHSQLYYRNVKIADLEPDFVIDNAIILELKAIQSEFLPANYAQIISYLRATNNRLGILINFGLLKASFQRIPFTERPLRIEENFEELHKCEGDILRLRDSIVNVANELRLGYHIKIYRQAMKVELKLGEFSFSEQVKVSVDYHNIFLNNYQIDYWLINEKILFAVRTGRKQIRAYDIMRMRSYLKKLKLKFGLIAFWGKDHLNIFSVSPLR